MISLDARCEATLRLLYEKAKDTAEGFVTCCEIGLRGEDRKAVCAELQKEGYIENYEAIGQSAVRCQLTSKAFSYFES